MWRTSSLLATLFVIGACGTSQMPPPERMRSLIREVRAETERHANESSSAASLGELRLATARHEAITYDLMTDMGMEVADSDHCTGSGMSELRARHADGLGEMGRHASAIDQAVGLDQGMAEVELHVTVMRLVFDAMDLAVDAMACAPSGGVS